MNAKSDRIANADEPGAEIEITSEMVAAGELAFSEHDPRFEGDAEMVKRVFRAMTIAQLQTQRRTAEDRHVSD